MGSLYLFSLLVGGFFVTAALVSGGDHDADADGALDLGLHVDADGPEGVAEALHLDMQADIHELPEGDIDAEHALDIVHGHSHALVETSGMMWLPVLSFRFWTFGTCFFGLTGGLLTWLGLATQGVVLAVALGMGVACGTAASWTVSKLKTLDRQTRSVTLEDYVGAIGTVVLPVGESRTGKVRCELRGQTLDLLVRTEEKEVLDVGTKVLLIGVEDGEGLVVHAGRLLSGESGRRVLS